MDDLLKHVTQKTGLPADQVRKVVESALEFIKPRLPAGLGGQVDQLLQGGGGAGGGGGLGDVAKNLGGMFGGGQQGS